MVNWLIRLFRCLRGAVYRWLDDEGPLMGAAVQAAVSVVANVCVFALIYRYPPRAPVGWGDALRGALVAACLWEVGRQVLATYLISSTYGSA